MVDAAAPRKEEDDFREEWKYVRKWLPHIANMGVSFIVTRSLNCNVMCYKFTGTPPRVELFWVNLETCRQRNIPPQPIPKAIVEAPGPLEMKLAFGVHLREAQLPGGARQLLATLRACPTRSFVVDPEDGQCFLPAGPEKERAMPIARIHVAHTKPEASAVRKLPLFLLKSLRVNKVIVFGHSKTQKVTLEADPLARETKADDSET